MPGRVARSIAPGRRISSLIATFSLQIGGKIPQPILTIKENVPYSFSWRTIRPTRWARHNMPVKAECSCGDIRYCRSADLMMVYGGGVDPLKLKFDCSQCKPQIKITLLEVHPEHLPKRLMFHQANEDRWQDPLAHRTVPGMRAAAGPERRTLATSPGTAQQLEEDAGPDQRALGCAPGWRIHALKLMEAKHETKYVGNSAV
jgi:hypothetical protein